MKLAIIGAMTVEVNLLKNNIKNLQIDKEGAFEFYHGTIEGIDVVVLLSGIGKVSSSVGTTLLIERYQPDFIINTGTAGGLGNIKMGDLVIGTQVGYHDVDVTAFGYEYGQMAQQPAFFEADSYLLKIIKHSIQDLNKKQSIREGVILSGDSFMSDKTRVQKVEKQFPDALAVEMESAAIAQTCMQMNIPFAVVRSISDMAGEGDAKSYESFVEKAGSISAKMIINCIKKIKNG